MSERTRHLILMNQILDDTRLPPEGFRPTFADMIPVGRDYGGAPPYQHWDDVSYTFTAPDVTRTEQGMLKVRAMFQSTDGEVVQFLIDNTAGKQESTDLAMVWEALGHAPPQEMVVAELPITITERVAPPDMGSMMGSPDMGSSSSDLGSIIEVNGGGGCKCSASAERRGPGDGVWLLAGLSGLCGLIGLRRIRRRG